MSALKRILGEHSDIAMVVLVVGVLTVLFAPIPSPLLDMLILTNFSFALLLLLLTFYMAKPVEFSTFPSLLLIATLFRLALNVAATRLILTDADAGQVIASVGSFVVGGNYVIGLIVFLILVVVQYVVVTSGAQRVSEVAARFTLDSMPGQQMSIDADLNMGFIDQAEAQRRRKNLEKEAAFYGAMDGASKFVKGDAIAGIVILLINIVGGLIIGVMQLGMSWGEALQTFTLLTIGDGIVTQVPALVIAVGTGIIVTRSASDTHLSAEVLRQITSHPKAVLLVMAALAGLLLLPGIPVWPGLVLLCMLGVVAWFARGRAARNESSAHEKPADEKADPKSEDLYESMKVDVLLVQLGSQLSSLARGDGALLAERITTFRQQLANELGVVLPKVAFRESARLQARAYEIVLQGVVIGRGELMLDRLLAIHPTGDTKLVKGVETREPTYGLPAVWIEEGDRDHARAARYTLVDPLTVITTHFSEALRQHAPTLLTRTETDRLLQRVRQSHPGLVEELVPTVLPLSDVQKVLQALLREKVSIRHLEAIVEALLDAGRGSKDPAVLTEAVRQRLGAAICQQLVGDAQALQVVTLDPAVEQALTQQLRAAEPAHGLVLEPRLAEQLVQRLAGQAEQMMRANLLPVVLCAPDLRRHLRALVERAVPHMRVLSLLEVPNTLPLKSFGTVALPAAA